MKSAFTNKFFWVCIVLFISACFFPVVSAVEIKDGAAVDKPAGMEEKDGRLTAEFVDADIRDVLRTLGRLAGKNLVISEEVSGKISLSMKDVCFNEAIQAIMDIRKIGYEEIGNIIRIAPLADIQERQRIEQDLAPLQSTVIRLKYANANKIEPVAKALLSPRGSISIHHSSIRGGWPVVGIADGRSFGPAPRASIKANEFPASMVITDTASRIEKISELINKLDVKPRQILIEAVIAEIRYDDRKDIGINWETLTGPGAEGDGRLIIGRGREAGIGLRTGEVIAPAPGFTGLDITYARLTGMQMRATIRALELEGKATVLSSPRTLVLDGHEATVLVGLKHPIFETLLVGDIDPRVSESVSHYEPIGILLRVVPVVWENDLVNLSVHPAVTALGDEVVGASGIKAREIITQEVDTNISVRSGETVVIGGLISDNDELRHQGVPILSHIPVLGFFFRREVSVKSRQELVIFITPTVMVDPELTPSDEAGLESFRETLEGAR